VDAVLAGLFDIRAELLSIRALHEREEQRRAELAELGFFSRLIRRLAA